MAPTAPIMLRLPHKLTLLPRRSVGLFFLIAGHFFLALAPLLGLFGIAPLFAVLCSLGCFAFVRLRPHIVLEELVDQSISRLMWITGLYLFTLLIPHYISTLTIWFILVLCQSPISIWDALSLYHRRPLWSFKKVNL